MVILKAFLLVVMAALAVLTEVYVPQRYRWIVVLAWVFSQVHVTLAYFCRDPKSLLAWPRPFTFNSHLHQEQINDNTASMNRLNAKQDTFQSLLERQYTIMRREVVLRARQADSCGPLLRVFLVQLAGLVLFVGLIWVPKVSDMGDLLGKGPRKILDEVAEAFLKAPGGAQTCSC